jgi:acetylornithine deacetylase
VTDLDAVRRLAADLVRIDSRSFLSNIPVSDRIEAELSGFTVERLDYADAAGVPKRVLVAHRGPKGGLGLSGHMDTVPDTGWREDPWSARLDADGILHGLGSVDMKGSVAAMIVAAQGLPEDVPATLLITTDEETTKAGARQIAERSALARDCALSGILVGEPTGLVPVRGHRSHYHFYVEATGVQAHSSTGKGVNANWALIPFLSEMASLERRLRTEDAFRDPDYDPPFPDFNLVLDNHGTAINVTVARATARIKFRYTASTDPGPVVAAVRAAAERAGLAMTMDRDGNPPELPRNHPFVRMVEAAAGRAAETVPYGTDAAELQAIAPCVILGPGAITTAHTPRECARLSDLAEAVTLYRRLLRGAA